MKDPYRAREPSISIAYLQLLLEILAERGIAAATLRQAQEISARYARLRQAGFTFEFIEDEYYGSLILRERQPIPVMRQFFVENILLGVARATAVLLGRDLLDIPDMEICFDYAEPDHHRHWHDRLPTTRFKQAVNMVRLPLHYLSQRPVMVDPLASRGAIELCERELALVADQEADITQRVRAELVLAGNGYPDLEQVAKKLCVSTRTLKRKLQRHGTSFLLILEECRRRDTQKLLEHSGLSVQAVAARLGYLSEPGELFPRFQQVGRRVTNIISPAPSQCHKNSVKLAWNLLSFTRLSIIIRSCAQ